MIRFDGLRPVALGLTLAVLLSACTTPPVLQAPPSVMAPTAPAVPTPPPLTPLLLLFLLTSPINLVLSHQLANTTNV